MSQSFSSGEIEENFGINETEEGDFHLLVNHELVSLGVNKEGAINSLDTGKLYSIPCIKGSGQLEAAGDLDLGDGTLCIRGCNCKQGCESEEDASHAQILYCKILL